jgi:hypothetical protein
MKKYWIALLCVLLGVVTVSSGLAKDNEEASRLLTGKVLDQQERPVQNAVVYLSNTRTKAIKTYIAGPDGAFHFPGLSPNVDYEVYAQYQGHKSDTKTASQFDNRKQVNVNLRIDVK